MAATTSIEDSGLLDVLAAEFSRVHPEIELSPVAVSTGQAIQLARRGDADVVLSHDSVAESQLVTEGLASERRSVMYNDFVIAGPAGEQHTDPIETLRTIAGKHSMFISRGDDSGTYRKEMTLWKAAGISPSGSWYINAGLGMGDALLLAGEKRAYILADRGTYLRFASRTGLAVICEGDPLLLNHYGVTVMKGPRAAAAQVFAEWIVSASAQRLIGEFGRKQFGQRLFTPSAPSPTL